MSRGEAVDDSALANIPHLAVEVVIAGKQIAPRERKCDRGDAAEDPIRHILIELAIGAQVKEATRGIIGASAKRLTVRIELHGVDIRLVKAGVGLGALLLTHVPDLGSGITGA